MKAASLDRRVTREATLLVRDARAALTLKKGLKGKGGDLEAVTAVVEKALAAKDSAALRAHLPVLDGLVDELVERAPRSTLRDYVESIGAAVLIALALRAFVIEAFKIPSSSMYPTLEINDHIFVNKFIYGVRIPWTTTKLLDIRGPKRGEVIVFIWPCNPDRDYIKRVVALAGDTVEVRCNIVYVNGTPIPSELVDADRCRYEDRGEEEGAQWEVKRCSRYRETVNGQSYDTYHSPARPQNDREGEPVRVDDSRDFPLRGRTAPTCRGEVAKAEDDHQVVGEIRETKSANVASACEPQLQYVVPPGHVFAMGDNRANSKDSRYWGSVPLENIKGKAMFIWLSYKDLAVDPTHAFGLRLDRMGNFVP